MIFILFLVMLFISFKPSRRVEASRGISDTKCIIVKIILKKFELPLFVDVFNVVLIVRFSICDISLIKLGQQFQQFGFNSHTLHVSFSFEISIS